MDFWPTVYSYLNIFISYFFVPLAILWLFVLNGLRMLVAPEKWMATAWLARRYSAQMWGRVTNTQLRFVGFGWAVGGSFGLACIVRQWFR